MAGKATREASDKGNIERTLGLDETCIWGIVCCFDIGFRLTGGVCLFYDNLRLLFGVATLLFLGHPTLHSAYIHMVNWRLCTVTLPFIAVWDTAFSDGHEWPTRFQNLVALVAGGLRRTPVPLSQRAGLLHTFTPAWFLFHLPFFFLAALFSLPLRHPSKQQSFSFYSYLI